MRLKTRKQSIRNLVQKNLPTPGDLHVNGLLTQMSVAHYQEATNFVATRFMPIVRVDKKTDIIPKYDRADLHRVEMEPKARGAGPARGGFRVDTSDTYKCVPYALAKPIYDQDRDNQDDPFDMDVDAAEYLDQQLLLKYEEIFANNLFTTGVWGADITGVAGAPGASQVQQWDQAGSTPIDDLDALMIDQAEKTGNMPNNVMMGPRVWQVFKNHPDVVGRFAGSERGIITTAMVEELLSERRRLPIRLLVPMSTRNTAAEGATQSNSFFFGKNVLLGYVNPRPALRRPSAGYFFAWNREGTGANGARIKRYRMEEDEADMIEIQANFDPKVVDSVSGTFISGAVG